MNAQFRSSFAKDLREVKNKDILTKIKDAIEQVEKVQGPQGIAGIKKLRQRGKYFRIRIGEYRIGLTIENDTVIFVRCLNRKEIYRYFP